MEMGKDYLGHRVRDIGIIGAPILTSFAQAPKPCGFVPINDDVPKIALELIEKYNVGDMKQILVVGSGIGLEGKHLAAIQRAKRANHPLVILPLPEAEEMGFSLRSKSDMLIAESIMPKSLINETFESNNFELDSFDPYKTNNRKVKTRKAKQKKTHRKKKNKR